MGCFSGQVHQIICSFVHQNKQLINKITSLNSRHEKAIFHTYVWTKNQHSQSFQSCLGILLRYSFFPTISSVQFFFNRCLIRYVEKARVKVIRSFIYEYIDHKVHKIGFDQLIGYFLLGSLSGPINSWFDRYVSALIGSIFKCFPEIESLLDYCWFCFEKSGTVGLRWLSQFFINPNVH